MEVDWNDGSADAAVVAQKAGVLPRSPRTFDNTGIQIVDVSLNNSQGLIASGEFKIRVLPATGGIVGSVTGDVSGRRRPLGGYTFYLDLQQDGQLDTGDPTAVSNAKGVYRFSGVLPGAYRVGELIGSQTDISSPVARYDEISVTRHVVRVAPFVDVVSATQATGITLTTVATLNQPVKYEANDVGFMQVDSEGDIYVASTGGGVSGLDGGDVGMLFRIPAGLHNLQVPAAVTWSEDDFFGETTGLELDTSGHLYTTSYTDFGAMPTSTTDRLDVDDGAYDFHLEMGMTSLPIFDEAGDAFIAQQPQYPPQPDYVVEIPVGTSNAKTIFNFNSSIPSSLTIDAAGNLYGIVDSYSISGSIAISFPPSLFEIAEGTNAVTTLYTFPASVDYEITDLLSDSHGDLFATTENSNNSTGTVIELPAGASAITQLGSFDAVPSPDLTFDSSGNLFGEVPAGGSVGKGEVFEVPADTGTLSSIFSFEGADGDGPDGLIIDNAGDLFGITSGGGKFGGGTAFKIGAGTLTLTTLVNFEKRADGADPTVGLYADGSGNLYGATVEGGKYGDGNIFKISGAGFIPAYQPAGSVTGNVSAAGTPMSDVTVLANSNGNGRDQSTTTDANGNFIFDALSPGNYTLEVVLPAGYEVAAPTSGSYDLSVNGNTDSGENFSLQKATLISLANFNGTTGDDPGDLIMDSSGDLFGTTSSGGPDDDGTVFELPAGSGNIKTIAAFNDIDGQDPEGILYRDSSGNIFGTAKGGGLYDDGTVFEIPAGTSTIVTLHDFTGRGGLLPTSGITADAAGNLYGTTSAVGNGSGSTLPSGTIFKITMGTLAFTTLVALPDISPTGTLFIDSNGNLFSSTTDLQLIELAAGASAVTTFFPPLLGGAPLDANGVTKDSAGNFYMASNVGTLYQIAPTNTGNPTGFYLAMSDPSASEVGVPVIDAAGDIFGTTGDGIVYEIPAATGVVSDIFSSSAINSANTDGNLIANSHGDLFGTIPAGGSKGDGSIFEITDAGFVVGG